MLRPLDRALRRLTDETGACAAVVWNCQNRPPLATVVRTHPDRLLPVGTVLSLPGETFGTVATDPARLATVIPTAVLPGLPASPAAAQTFSLNEHGLVLLIVWCVPPDAAASGPTRATVDEIADQAAMVRDIRFGWTEQHRLDAVVNALNEGVVTVDHQTGQATVNPVAAALLDIPPGSGTAIEFADAMRSLFGRAVNRPEITAVADGPVDEPGTEVTWRFGTQPSHVRVACTEVRNEGFDGRVWVFTDESALNQALETSELASATMRATADAMIDPQAVLRAVRDIGGRIVDFSYIDVNAAMCGYLGMSRPDLLGTSLLQASPNLEGSGLLGHYIHCTDTGERLILDDFYYYSEILAAARRYDIRAAVVDADTISLTWRDVTDRFETALAVAESEERFRLLTENSGDLVVWIRDGKFVWLSPAAEQVYGAPPEHWVGRAVLDTVAAGGEADYNAAIRQLQRGEPFTGRLQIARVDGSPHWVHVNAKQFYDGGGHQDGVTASIRLIDGEVEAEQKLEEARRTKARADERYRRLMDNSAIGMCLLTPDGRFDTVNPALCEFFGYDAEQLRQKNWQDITADGDLEVDVQSRADLLAGRTNSYRKVKRCVHADGHLIWGDLSVSCLRDEDGKVENLVAQIIDVTAEMEARRQVAERDEKNRILNTRLQAKTDRLVAELDSAASYVASLLPGDMAGSPQVSSRYAPSRELAGDCFDYTWVDDDHLVVYLLDVSGHGVAPALMSISVHNMLRSVSLPIDVVLAPAALLAELNRKFQMDRQGGNYFTMWYGVYQRSTRTLRYACAGHPPALLFTSPGRAPAELAAEGLPIGMFEDTDFTARSVAVPRGARLLLYSDGAYEITLGDGTDWLPRKFVTMCAEVDRDPRWSLDALLSRLQALSPAGVLEDDCSLVKLTFD